MSIVGKEAMAAIKMEEAEAALAVVVEAIMEVMEATVNLAVITISLQIVDSWMEETLEAECLGPVVVEANTLSNHKIKLAMVVPEVAAVGMALAEGFKYFQETKLNRRGEPEK